MDHQNQVVNELFNQYVELKTPKELTKRPLYKIRVVQDSMYLLIILMYCS